MVHVGAVDAPVTLADVKAIAREAWKAVGKDKDSPTKAGVDVLGWEFALEVNELAKQVAAEFKTIRAYYSENVVNKVVKGGAFKASHDHKGNDAAVPLPATFIHDFIGILRKCCR